LRHYLNDLAKERRIQSSLLGRHRKVVQLHLGGGTPTFFDAAELTELVHLLA
jgi:oxygen-independent coproporphyrinogen-3 oxidase